MFQSKRLCERWLDNLFMVLYEVSSPFPTYATLSPLVLGGHHVHELIVGFTSVYPLESGMGTLR
jgi:hypothetical protein